MNGDGEETRQHNDTPTQAALLADTDSAMCHTGTFVMWAWGFKERIVADLRLMMRLGITELLQYARDHHQLCILPPGTVPVGASVGGRHTGGRIAVLSQQSENLSRQTESMTIMNNLHRAVIRCKMDKDDKEKDRMKDFHPSIMNTICFTSAHDSKSTPTSAPPSFLRVTNSKTAGTADIKIYQQFSSMGMKDIYFAHGTTLARHSGNLLYCLGNNPSNFSTFCLCHQQSSNKDITGMPILLHIMEE